MTTRRRGRALETAILNEVRTRLREQGYSSLTFEGVATAVATSKPVLYRRWPTKAAMVAAALTDSDAIRAFVTPDTGTLSGDICALLCLRRDLFDAHHRSGLLGLLAELDETASVAIWPLLFAKHAEWLDPIVQRARLRGELGPGALPKRVASLPFDLLRHDVLIAGVATDESIAEVVRSCVIPLFQASTRA